MSDRVETSIEIGRPVQHVWDFIMDPATSHDWVTIHRRDVRHDDGALHVGYEMTQKLCLRGVPFDVDWSLAELDAPHRAIWEGKGPARSHARIEDRLSETADGGTRFDYANEFRAPLGPLGRVASRALVGGIPRKEADASLRRLKEILERP